MKQVVPPNKLVLNEVSLIPHTGDAAIDLRPNIVEISIYEDIFSHFLKATIVYADAAGLMETAPIIGEEFVAMSFRAMGKPTDSKTTEMGFFCHSIEKRERMEDRSEVFVLNLISPEAIVNMKSSSKNSHVGKTIKNIILEEYENGFTNNEWTWGKSNQIRFLGNKKNQAKINVDETTGLHAFVPPMMKPFEFMSYLTKEAISPQFTESDFIFYRNSDSYNFKTISSLFEQEPVESYYFIDPNTQKNTVRRHQIIYNFGFRTLPNHIERLKSGAYQNNTSSLNLITKEYKTNKFNYYDEFYRNSKDASFTNLGNNPLMSRYSVNRNLDMEAPSSRFIVTDSSRTDIPYDQYQGHDYDVEFPSKRFEISTKRDSKIGQFKTGNRLWISVSGDNELKVGQIINVFIPQNAITEQLKTRYNLLFTKDNESKFMITALVHNYNKIDDEFITRIECVTDSYENSIDSVEKYFRNNEELFT